MHKFTAKYGDKIQGILNGFDRLVFRGTLRKIAYVFGMQGYLWANQVLLKNFGAHVQEVSERVKEASLRCAQQAGRPVMTSFRSPEVLRFLGKKLTRAGQVDGRVNGEVTSDFRRRQEGVRIKHRYNSNSVKLYDKAYTVQGSVLRAELTIQDPEPFQVYRRREGDSEGPLEWHRMRKGIADLHRRAVVSQQAHERYLDAFASVDDSISLQELLRDITQPVSWNGKRVRALHPFEDDWRLLEAISGGEFTIHGLRNKDLQALQTSHAARAPAPPQSSWKSPLSSHRAWPAAHQRRERRVPGHGRNADSKGCLRKFFARQQDSDC